MARTDTLGNFLIDVADAIRTKKGSSDTILASDFDTEIENLPTGGNSQVTFNYMYHVAYDNTSSINISPDNFFSARANGATDSSTNNYASDYKNQTTKGIIFAFVRSNYTLSDNLELIAESEWFTGSGTNQKLIVCWCEGDSATITTASSGRAEAEFIALSNAKKITSNDVFLNNINSDTSSSYNIVVTDKICIFSQSCIFNNSLTADNTGMVYSQGRDRLVTEISVEAGQKTLVKSNQHSTAIIGIEVQAE